MAVILCDLDGTLLVKPHRDPPGTVSPKRAAINQALAEVCEAPGVDFSTGLLHGLTDWQISERAICLVRPQASIDSATWRSVIARAAAVFELPAAGTPPVYRRMPGVPEVLHALREAGHVLGIVSGNISFFARFKLEQAGLDLDLFTGPQAFGDHGQERADILRAALDGGVGDGASGVVVLGDTVHDLAGARAVGLPFLGTGAMGLTRAQVMETAAPGTALTPVAWVADLGDPAAVVRAVSTLVNRSVIVASAGSTRADLDDGRLDPGSRGELSRMTVAQKPTYAELTERCARQAAELQMLRRRADASAQLDEGEARLRSILNRVENIPIQGYDHRRRVIYWNHASMLVYGYTQAEALGRLLEDLIIPEAMRDAVVAAVDAWIAGGPEVPASELVLRDKQGRDVPVYSSHIMHETRDGRREMYCVDVDLRELKRSEQERAQLAAEKAALQHQYLHAQKFEAVGQLAGGVAHDFNNLLQVIYGYTSLARADLVVDHPVRPLLDQVLGAGERAKRLVSQLLAVSRRQQLQLEECDLNQLVGEVFEMLERVIGEGITVHFEPGARQAILKADRGALEQVLLNLCVNARDAMPDGGTLTLRTAEVHLDEAAIVGHVDARPGRHVLLSVTDTGSGVPPELIERIFEPFFTTKVAGKGTGLGLATVQGLVAQHGGIVRCHAAPGGGSVFEVYLPVADIGS